jgi:hypothetical protein
LDHRAPHELIARSSDTFNAVDWQDDPDLSRATLCFWSGPLPWHLPSKEIHVTNSPMRIRLQQSREGPSRIDYRGIRSLFPVGSGRGTRNSADASRVAPRLPVIEQASAQLSRRFLSVFATLNRSLGLLSQKRTL